jgi:hypothetical protein
MYEYKVNNSPQTSWVALARATLEETINAVAGPAPLPPPPQRIMVGAAAGSGGSPPLDEGLRGGEVSWQRMA